MHPVIATIPFINFPIHSYGLMLALSFIVGIFLASYLAKKRGLDPNIISDAGFWIIISAIFGARLYYVILHFEEFQGDLRSIFWPTQGGSFGIGGLVMYGGFIGAILAGLIFFRSKKLPINRYCDVLAPGVGIGIFLTRIGCFLNGCCYGAPAAAGSGVNFPVISPAGHYQHTLHADALLPSQLYESVGGLLIAIVLLVLLRRRFFDGFQFYMLGLMYSVLRFAVDFSRYYGPGERIGSLSHNQVVCIVGFIVFGGLILKNILAAAEPATAAVPSAKADRQDPAAPAG